MFFNNSSLFKSFMDNFKSICHCRLGWLLRFISHSVISGFVTSSAIVIALSQAKYFLGYNVERSSQIVPLAKSIIAGAGDVSSLFIF